MRPLRVLFDATLASNPAGTGAFARGLLGALDHTDGVEIVRSRLPIASVGSVDVSSKAPGRRLLNALEHIRYFAYSLPARARQARCDVIFSPSGVGPLTGRIPAVVTILDLSPLRYPQTLDRVNRIYLRAMLRSQLRRSRGVCTITRAVGLELQERFPSLQAPIHVIPCAPDNDLLTAVPRPVTGIEQPFFLMVGTLEPRKNHLTAIEALSVYLREHPKARDLLVLAGSPGWLFQPVLEGIDRLGLQPLIRQVGRVDAGQLRWLYERARALIFPSLYEGFGIPVLEAFALGCPVIASRIPALVEVVGDAPATLLDPLEVSGWSSAMATASSTPRDPQSIARARARAAAFTWDDSARRLRDALIQSARGVASLSSGVDPAPYAAHPDVHS